MAGFIYEIKANKLSLKKIASELGMSGKMLAESIYEYKSFDLETCGLMINITENQYVTYQTRDFSFNKLKQVLLKRSLNFKLCQKIFTGEFTNVLEFSEEHYISIASMYRHVKELKKILNKYHLKLNLSQQPLIVGKEYHIRHFYFELYFAAYGLREDYLQHSQWQCDIQEACLTEIALPVRQKIKLLYYISFSRMAKNFYITEMTYLKPYNSFVLEEKLTAFYSHQLSKAEANKTKLTSELNFFLIYVLNTGIFDNDKLAQINFHVSEDSQELNEKFSWVRQWTSLFSNFFEVKLSSEIRLFLYANLYIYFISKEFFPYSTVNFNDELLTYQKENPYIWEKTLLFKKQLKQKFPKIVLSDYLTHFFIREIVCLTQEKIEICLFVSCSYSQNCMIEREIRKRTVVQFTLTRKITKKTKLIVSDLDFDLAKISSDNQLERVFIQTVPSESDYQLIAKKLLKLSL